MNYRVVWTIKSTGHSKFPYCVIVSKGKDILLQLYTQDKWPGTKGNIFCLRELKKNIKNLKEEQIVESVPVINYKMYGKKLTIILDRATRKRCNFLFLTKKYKYKEGEYEQIFWQTQQGLSQHRPKYKLAYNKKEELTVFIDAGERYPWKFPSTNIIKQGLDVGDYAIKDKFGILAIIERKTFNNLVGEFRNLKKLHQYLSELESRKNCALVIEANYNDFLDRKKIAPYTPSFAAKAIAEIQSFHPDLPIVFSGSRKSAIIWSYNFFKAISSRADSDFSEVIRDSVAKYGANQNVISYEDEVRRIIFTRMPDEFTIRQLKAFIPRLSLGNIRKILEKLKSEKLLFSEKSGRSLVWKKINE